MDEHIIMFTLVVDEGDRYASPSLVNTNYYVRIYHVHGSLYMYSCQACVSEIKVFKIYIGLYI